MTMGTDWDELSVPYTDLTNSEIAMDMAPDRYRFVLGAPVVMEPGRRWVYNGGATALLARIIERGTGKPLHALARETLFDPLEIGPTEWFTDNHGEAFAASGLRMTPRDLARIGVMMLKGGMAAERRVVPGNGSSVRPRQWSISTRPGNTATLVLGQFRFNSFVGTALEPVMARTILGCDRQWLPAAIFVSWARSNRGHNRRQLRYTRSGGSLDPRNSRNCAPRPFVGSPSGPQNASKRRWR
jgi:hypothetical protein